MADTFDFMNVNLNALTIGEIEEVEELTDMPFDQLASSGKKGKLMRAVAYVVKRREDPSFTWEQAGNLQLNMEATEAPLDSSSD